MVVVELRPKSGRPMKSSDRPETAGKQWFVTTLTGGLNGS